MAEVSSILKIFEKREDLIILLAIVFIIGIIPITTAQSNNFCFEGGCHSGATAPINVSKYDNSSHKYLQCIDCHVNVTEYPNSTHGNFINNLTLPRPSSQYNQSNFSLCYGCHKESNIIGIESNYSNFLWTHTTISGYPLVTSNIKTNFINKLFYGHNFANYPSNIHWDHLDMQKIDGGGGLDLIWDSDCDETLDSMASCSTCHEPHGNTTKPRLTKEDLGIEHGTDIFGEYGKLNNIQYQKPGGDLYCVGCHGINNKYYRPYQEVINFSSKHISSYNVSTCIRSGCHYSNFLPTEHVEKRNKTCSTCHQKSESRIKNAIQQSNTSCFACHTPHTTGSHMTHLQKERGPLISCPNCHGSNSPPMFADGNYLNNTTVCNTCHSPNGSYNGVNDSQIGAKTNWVNGVYNVSNNSTTLMSGKDKWCVGCHDNAPAYINGETAPNKTGDNSTYGYYVNGHGKASNYTRLSWQDMNATGNPGANRSCYNCHDITSIHIVSGTNPNGKRLKSGYENNQNNTNCNNCHTSGGLATANPQFYTTSSEFENSVHKNKNCTECHDVHGTSGPYIAMTRGNREELCRQCHVGKQGHAIDINFGKNGKNYTLECVSCHNVHIITGMYSQSNSSKSAVVKFSNNLEIWGDESDEKISYFAGSGTYRTPKNDTFSGSQLPDYPTFCLDCHGTSTSEFGPHGGIKWDTTEPHGLNSANIPNGGGACPDWFACGKAIGWDGDLCLNGEACWPVISSGKGEQIWTRDPYNQENRIAGANFVLNCIDCHVVHESGIGAKIRTIVNNGSGSTIWNTMCNNCHYYYSDWHAGMSCGSASCHVSDRMSNTGRDTIHGMNSNTGAGGTRTFNQDLVAYMKFDNDLTDSGTWRMSGKWFNMSGSYAGGKYGNAVVLNGDQPIELGTTNSYWSTDAGYHGTWVYSEMKYNMTLESWVYPTSKQSSGENHIFSKHKYTDGGYVLLLKEIGGTLRAALMTNVNGGESVWNSSDCNGLRGAYSTVPVPLNDWTHVSAVFDRYGLDSNPNNLSQGRIRIYVNGEDVTTSYKDKSTCYAQPSSGENSMFPYSDMSFKNESRCYLGTWCASALSVGGVMWGDGNRKGLIGRIDEAKVWNIAKTSDYFDSYDAITPPRIILVEGVVGRNWIIVSFNEGVYANTNLSGNLEPSDFTLTDTDNSRTITNVAHIYGSSTTNLTISSPLDNSNDINVDTIAAVSNSIYDDHSNPASTSPVTITSQPCPNGGVTFSLNENSGSKYATDDQGVLNGTVYGNAFGDGLFHGNGSTTYIDFENNTGCLQASSALTIETRIKPTGMGGTSDYVKRILARDGNRNYQLSVWRINSWANYEAPSGVGSIAFWVYPIDNHGGNAWKPALTDYDNYPIVSDHWYQVKVVWNSSKSGIPATIFVDDQGTDGNNTGENWSGYLDATDSDQSQLTPDRYLYEGDTISTADGAFTIGANVNNHANNVFNGKIDWITWKDVVE